MKTQIDPSIIHIALCKKKMNEIHPFLKGERKDKSFISKKERILKKKKVPSRCSFYGYGL